MILESFEDDDEGIFVLSAVTIVSLIGCGPGIDDDEGIAALSTDSTSGMLRGGVGGK